MNIGFQFLSNMCHYLTLIKHRLHIYICLLSFLTSIKIIIIKKRFRFFFQMHPYTFIFCYWHSPIIINRNLEIFSSSRTSLIIICLVKHCSEPYKININEDLPIKLEKKLKGKEVSIGDQKGNSVFIVTQLPLVMAKRPRLNHLQLNILLTSTMNKSLWIISQRSSLLK